VSVLAPLCRSQTSWSAWAGQHSPLGCASSWNNASAHLWISSATNVSPEPPISGLSLVSYLSSVANGRVRVSSCFWDVHSKGCWSRSRLKNVLSLHLARQLSHFDYYDHECLCTVRQKLQCTRSRLWGLCYVLQEMHCVAWLGCMPSASCMKTSSHPTSFWRMMGARCWQTLGSAGRCKQASSWQAKWKGHGSTCECRACLGAAGYTSALFCCPWMWNYLNWAGCTAQKVDYTTAPNQKPWHKKPPFCEVTIKLPSYQGVSVGFNLLAYSDVYIALNFLGWDIGGSLLTSSGLLWTPLKWRFGLNQDVLHMIVHTLCMGKKPVSCECPRQSRSEPSQACLQLW